MIAFLLFLILVVLLYSVGLLPGVMKFLSGLFALILVFVAIGLYGLPAVVGAVVAALLVAVFGILVTFWWVSSSSKIGRVAKSHRGDLERQLAKINAEQAQKRKAKEEAQKVSEPTPVASPPVTTTRSAPPADKPMPGELERPVEVRFSYRGQRDSAPKQQHVSIQRVSTQGGRVFLKALCLQSGAVKMFMVDRIKGDIASASKEEQVNPQDHTRVEALRAALAALG
ncbi:hypothetical protein CLM76_09440 [Vreelandella venusta]|nr:hypothetical protein CLM76_09440 [Halomonas hydrothermalis]